MEDGQDIIGWAMLDTARLDVEDTAVVRTVQFVMEINGLFKWVLLVSAIKGLPISAVTNKGV